MKGTGWDPYLEDGERILWQGHPRREFVLPGVKISAILFGMVFVGFSVFWMIGAAREGGFIWMFGLIFFFIGLGLVYRNVLEPTLRRWRTHYTLTDRRIFIATNMPFERRRLHDYRVTPTTPVELSYDGSSSIWLGEGRTAGFSHIEDSDRVYQLIKNIQNRPAAGEKP